MSVQQTEEYRKLGKLDKEVFAEMLLKAREAERLCKKTPHQQLLTKEEYEKAHPDFKVLVETPWARKEPIYITSEFIDGQLNPKLEHLKSDIEGNLPYHSFIKEGYATTWPLLLRLYYGLQSGFRISIEQFHSMLKVSYWRALGLKIETLPLLEGNPSRLTEFSVIFMEPILSLMRPEQSHNFINKLQSAPVGERSALLIELDATLLNICNQTREDDDIQRLALRTRIPIWERLETFMNMQAGGLQMFAALLTANLWPYHPFTLNDHLYVLIPSQTIIQTFAQVINPTRTVKYVRRLGAISSEMMAKHSANNERAGNLIAPGIGVETDITNYVVHEKVTPPALLVEHDDYHDLLEATISRLLYEQIMQIPDVLAQHIKVDPKVTSEFDRCIEREKTFECSEQVRFFELLKYVFAVNPDAESENFVLRKSSLLVLIDMVLNPQKWAYYSSNKARIVELLLPREANKFLGATEVEKVIQDYFLKVKKDLRLLALLLLIHFYLNDVNLCLAILSLPQPNNAAIQLTWQKGEDSGLVPIFSCCGINYSLKQLANMQPLARMKLIAASTKTLYSIPEGIVVDEKVKQTILANQGEIINAVKPCQFTMPCAALTAGVRKVLGLDRLRSVNPEGLQLDYLKHRVPEIIIEKDPNKDQAFLCTFPERKRATVEAILSPEKWQKTKRLIVKMQALVRGHRERGYFFKEVNARKIRVQNLKTQINSANEKELFTNVSSLAIEAQQEVDILKIQERVMSGWSRKK